jgi:uncharacterized protein YeaO (DUF488 family)
MAPMPVRTKRVYEDAVPSDGYRVLIDRIWPRGVTRDAARLDEWARDLAPSTELRRFFDHDPARFEEFRRRYVEELEPQARKVNELRSLAQKGTVTIVFAARDREHSNAAVLAELLGAA